MRFTASRDAWVVIGIFLVIIIIGVVGGRHMGKNPAGAPAHAEQAFAPGGTVYLDLEAGDYEIYDGVDNKIVANAEGKNADKDVHVTIDVNGNVAHINTRTDEQGNGHFRIELPAKSDIDLHLTAGDLKIRGITGNKSVDSKAGNVEIEVGDPNQYSSVTASMLAGDVNAPAFGHSTSGVGNTFSWNGPGQYKIYVHLLAGDLTLR
jgi:DUF4097 and DUF4098 domain-containing protein YvlB